MAPVVQVSANENNEVVLPTYNDHYFPHVQYWIVRMGRKYESQNVENYFILISCIFKRDRK